MTAERLAIKKLQNDEKVAASLASLAEGLDRLAGLAERFDKIEAALADIKKLAASAHASPQPAAPFTASASKR
jgi:hypothetical protein